MRYFYNVKSGKLLPTGEDYTEQQDIEECAALNRAVPNRDTWTVIYLTDSQVESFIEAGICHK